MSTNLCVFVSCFVAYPLAMGCGGSLPRGWTAQRAPPRWVGGPVCAGERAGGAGRMRQRGVPWDPEPPPHQRTSCRHAARRGPGIPGALLSRLSRNVQAVG